MTDQGAPCETEWITPTELATRWRVSREKVRQMLESGDVPSMLLPGSHEREHRRIQLQWVIDYEAAQ